jgi:antitoxin PrlF
LNISKRRFPETTMSSILKVESALTDRYQTTVPEMVRRALRLGKRDRIQYTIRPDGQVLLKRATVADSDDPALMPFLGFLARDVVEHPERLEALDAELLQRIRGLIDGVEVDLDAPLRPEDE